MEQVTWGNLLNLLGVIVAAIGVMMKISASIGELRLTIERYHRENTNRITALETEMRSIQSSIARTRRD